MPTRLASRSCRLAIVTDPLGPCDAHVKPPPIGQETNVAPRVAANCREYDHILLPALEAVDSLDLNIFKLGRALGTQLFDEGFFPIGIDQQVVADKPDLCRIRRDDADIRRLEIL